MSLRLRYSDPQGGPVQFQAVGLPSGLSLNSKTGRISGQTTRRGTFHTMVAAEDSRGSIGGGRFSWVVGGATRVVAVTVRGGQQPSLSLTVIAGRSAPALSQLVITPPKQLRFASPRGLTVSAPGQHPSETVHLVSGSLILTLRHSLPRLSLKLAYPSLRAVGSHPNSGSPSGQLLVKATDANQGTSHIRARVG